MRLPRQAKVSNPYFKTILSRMENKLITSLSICHNSLLLIMRAENHNRRQPQGLNTFTTPTPRYFPSRNAVSYWYSKTVCYKNYRRVALYDFTNTLCFKDCIIETSGFQLLSSMLVASHSNHPLVTILAKPSTTQSYNSYCRLKKKKKKS